MRAGSVVENALCDILLILHTSDFFQLILHLRERVTTAAFLDYNKGVFCRCKENIQRKCFAISDFYDEAASDELF